MPIQWALCENVLISGLAGGGFSPFSLAFLLSSIVIQSATVQTVCAYIWNSINLSGSVG